MMNVALVRPLSYSFFPSTLPRVVPLVVDPVLRIF